MYIVYGAVINLQLMFKIELKSVVTSIFLGQPNRA